MGQYTGSGKGTRQAAAPPSFRGAGSLWRRQPPQQGGELSLGGPPAQRPAPPQDMNQGMGGLGGMQGMSDMLKNWRGMGGPNNG